MGDKDFTEVQLENIQHHALGWSVGHKKGQAGHAFL